MEHLFKHLQGDRNHVKGSKKSGTEKTSYSQSSKKSKARVTSYISLTLFHILHVENCRHTYTMKKSSWLSWSCCLMRQQEKKPTLILFCFQVCVTSGIQLKVLSQMPNSEQLEVTRPKKTPNPKTLQGYHKSGFMLQGTLLSQKHDWRCSD